MNCATSVMLAVAIFTLATCGFGCSCCCCCCFVAVVVVVVVAIQLIPQEPFPPASDFLRSADEHRPAPLNADASHNDVTVLSTSGAR